MAERLTPKLEAEMRAREAAATPGPWIVDDYCLCADGEDGLEICDMSDFPNGQWLRNLRFIAASRVYVPVLIDEIDRQRTAMKAAREALECYVDNAEPEIDALSRGRAALALLAEGEK